LDDPLIYVRAIHFAATITVAGVVFFVVFIAEPAFRKAAGDTRLPAAARPPLAWLAWIGLVLAVASGAAWFILVAASMGERPVAEVFSEGFLWIVLLQTEFGRAWLMRAILAGLLAAVYAVTLTTKRRRATSTWRKIVAVALAGGLVGIWRGGPCRGRHRSRRHHPFSRRLFAPQTRPDILSHVRARARERTLKNLARGSRRNGRLDCRRLVHRT
jgi:putative copper resistance protein D